jgi:hypothetical protein
MIAMVSYIGKNELRLGAGSRPVHSEEFISPINSRGFNMRLAHVRRLHRYVCGLALALSLSGGAAVASDTYGWPGYGEVTYVSKGLNFHRKWGTFVLHPGVRGRATYTFQNEPIREVRLEFVAVFPSSTDPYVLFAVYREAGPNPAGMIRQWAFQIDYQTFNGYVIYYKDNQTSVWEPGWQIYDFAGKHPER